MMGLNQQAVRYLQGVVSLLPLSVLAESAGLAEWGGNTIEESSIAQLEQRLDYIDQRLNELADFHIITGMGPIGYRSHSSATAIPEKEWVEIHFKQPQQIDQVVIVPTLWRSTRDGPQADAFPVQFHVLAIDEVGDPTIIAEYDSEDQLTPRIAPLVIDLEPQVASSVRIEATELSGRAWDNLACLQLSEVLVFNGNENVALHQEISASSSESIDSRQTIHLVDGFLPYLMGLKTGQQSTAFLAKHSASLEPEIIIDLGASYPVNHVNLHAIESSDTIPQTVPSDYAFPRHLIIDGANQADFSDASRLFEYRVQSVFDLGPILSERFAKTHCRYIRIRAPESYQPPASPEADSQFGLAEIEVYADGLNVAIGKKITANIQTDDRVRRLEALNDGLNFFGEIIPARGWLKQLSERHELERQRPLVEQALKEGYARQRVILNQMIWLVVVIALIAIFVTVVMRLMAQRSIQRLRERIAADLHDELGANLHAIGLLSDLSQRATDNPTKLGNLLQRIRNLTERTGAAARHCINMLEAEELYNNVANHFERVSRRLLNDVHYDLTMEGAEHLEKLSPRRKIDLCLFYQECLTNIIRHSGATEVDAVLKADKQQVALSIIDNGVGLEPDRANEIPKSISRRSRLLGSKVIVDSPQNEGTRILLILKLGGFRIP